MNQIINLLLNQLHIRDREDLIRSWSDFEEMYRYFNISLGIDYPKFDDVLDYLEE